MLPRQLSKAHAHAIVYTDRQRTLRELEVGKTLFKDGGRRVIKHQAGDYRTSCALMTSCFHDKISKLMRMPLSLQTVSAH